MLLSKVKIENGELCGEFSQNPVGADGKYLQRQIPNFTGDNLNSQRLPRSTDENTEPPTQQHLLRPENSHRPTQLELCTEESLTLTLLLMMKIWNKFTI